MTDIKTLITQRKDKNTFRSSGSVVAIFVSTEICQILADVDL